MVETTPIFKTQDDKTNDKSARVVDGFDNFLSKIGLNNNNAISAGVYTFNLLTRNRIQLEAAYRGSWIVGRVVDTIAEDMTKAGIDISTAKEEKNIKKIQAGFSKLAIWSTMREGLQWGRLYGGGLCVLQIEGQDLSTPLNLETVSKGQFKGLIAYDRWQLQPDLTHIIDMGPEIGLPKYYDIITTSVTGQPSSEALAPEIQGQPSETNMGGFVRVHHSRVIRMIGIQLPFWQAITEMMWGESILERLWDRLIAFDTATMSAANLLERANNRMIGIDGLRDILASGGQAQAGLEKMFAMMAALQTNEGITLLDKNDTFQTSNYTFTGLSDILLQFAQQLAGASNTPLIRLLGQSPAGLNATGDSDIRMYYDDINSQQNARLRPGVDLLLRVMWRSELGSDVPDDMEFMFVPLWQMTAKDKADIAKSNAETIAGAKDAGLVSQTVAMKELRDQSKETGLFGNITDEDIVEAEKEELEDPPLPGEVDPDASVEPSKALALVKNQDSKRTSIRDTIRRWVGR